MQTLITPHFSRGVFLFCFLLRLLAVPWVKVEGNYALFSFPFLSLYVFFSALRRRNVQSEAFFLPSAVAVLVFTFVLVGVCPESAVAQRLGTIQKASKKKSKVEELPRIKGDGDPSPGGTIPPPPVTPGGGGGGAPDPFVPVYIPIIQPPPPPSGDPNYVPPGIGGGSGGGQNPAPPVVNPPPPPDGIPIEGPCEDKSLTAQCKCPDEDVPERNTGIHWVDSDDPNDPPRECPTPCIIRKSQIQTTYQGSLSYKTCEHKPSGAEICQKGNYDTWYSGYTWILDLGCSMVFTKYASERGVGAPSGSFICPYNPGTSGRNGQTASLSIPIRSCRGQ